MLLCVLIILEYGRLSVSSLDKDLYHSSCHYIEHPCKEG